MCRSIYLILVTFAVFLVTLVCVCARACVRVRALDNEIETEKESLCASVYHGMCAFLCVCVSVCLSV